MKNYKPYKYDSKNRVYNEVKNKKKTTNYNLTSDFYKKDNVKKKKKEKTPTNIRIDMNRINDSESLDTSFLEGRIVKNEKKEKKIKEKILSDKPVKSKEAKKNSESLVNKISFLRKAFLSLAAVCVILLVTLFLFDLVGKIRSNNRYVDVDEVLKDISNSTNAIDNNYLFLGDFNTYKFDFKYYGLDYHYVKVASNVYTTTNLFDKFKRDVYDYNPSVIFIQLGVVDLSKGKAIEEIAHNIEIIIDNIKENRPYAKIYIESLYPINKDVDNYNNSILGDNVTNSKIEDLNKLIKKSALDKGVNYLDIYSLLVKDGKLNSSYTDNGVYINNDGYEVILKEIKSIVG